MTKTLKLTHHSLPMGPSKLRPVCDLVRGQSVSQALITLRFTPRVAATALAKKLQATASSAIDHSLDPERLVVRAIFCDQRSVLKRQRIRSRGRSSVMRKRGSSVTIELAEQEEFQPRNRSHTSAQQAAKTGAAQPTTKHRVAPSRD